MSWRVCSRPGCPNLHDGLGKCPECKREADGTRTSGAGKYGTEHRTRFRPGVLLDDAGNQRHCVGLDNDPCTQLASVADHWPLDRTELVARGMDPDDPANGRPLCETHHNRWTAQNHGFGTRE